MALRSHPFRCPPFLGTMGQMNFWDIVKEVSAQPVRREASRLFVLALAGDPGSVGADVLMLTKNQVFLILRLAAVHGQDPQFLPHSKEIASVIGGAFGWRTLARELAGVLPRPLGLPIRIGIAYSGTYTVGKAAQM